MTEPSRYARLLTEQRNPRSEDLDRMSIAEIVDLMQDEDRTAVEAVAAIRDDITRAVEIVSDQLRLGGRLIYVGAGTSGRLGVLDASECPPTFRSDPNTVQGIIAGGDIALRSAQEGAEDSRENGGEAIIERDVGELDVVMGIASSGVTPYVHGAMEEARKRGAKVLFLTCTPPSHLNVDADLVLAPLVGPEVVTGSTRLKAGTATKLVLNRITTISMIRLGKVHGNLMVDLDATCGKLVDRARRIVSQVTGLTSEESEEVLARAGGKAKLAIVMAVRGATCEEAERLLTEADGHLRTALDSARDV